MKAALTEELRQAIRRSGGEPVEIEDRQTKQVYFLVPQEQYEQFRELLSMHRLDRSLYEFTDEVVSEGQ